ncbi:MAG TPA: ferric reductase-like transmembrane domain-containing protein [Kofleriaceae bacterium]|jgi:ferredoxin-NADP reductase/DMSO/TMAO reductase YedYZ heme-binding membrane subunit
MSTSRVVDTKFAKLLAIVNACVPAVILLWDAIHHQLGVNEVNYAIRTTGLIGLTCLVLTLVITPLRRLTGAQTLIAIRRNLGVAGFFYISLHFLIFFWWDRDASITSTAHEIVTREYLWFGFGALVIMIPLAVTSTDAMVSRLGAKRWKRLHRLTYVVVLAGCVHYLLLVKSDTRPPLAFTSVVVALLLFRAIGHELDLRRELRAARGKLALAKTAKKPAFWSGELEIARIFQETPDVKTFRFVHPDGGPLPFSHVAGQYLNLALTIDGKRVNRSYTIASSPTRQAYVEISVKRAANGYGSKHLHDTWHEGDLVKVSAPAGKFFFAGHEATRVVLIAGGIGITPMMSVTRSLTDRGWKGDIYLVFSVRKRVDIVFETELEYLKARHPNLHVLVTVTDDPAWTGERGRISADLLRAFVPDFTHGPVMLCGPDPMMTAMRALLVGMGIPDGEVHQEAFVSPPAIVESTSPTDEDPPLLDGETAMITFGKSRTTAQVTNATTILEAAEEAGVAMPFECRSGICGQCKTRLVSGKVRMTVQDALTNHDRAKGLVLACQAHATRDCTVDA